MKKNKTVKKATTEKELKRIFSFRYAIYHKEFDFHFPYEDNENMLLDEGDIDRRGVNLYIEDLDGDIIGVMRMIIFSPDNELIDHKYGKLYNFQAFAHFLPLSRTIISRFLVAVPYRAKSLIAWKLMAESYRQNDLYGSPPIVFIDCSPSLVKFYEGLGFRRYFKNFNDPILGYKVPLVLLLQDVEHIRKVKSPIYIFARKRQDSISLGGWFHENFSEYTDSPFANSISIQRLLAGILDVQPKLALSYTGLSSQIKSSCYLKVDPGDHILRQGDIAREMYLIISGSVEITRKNQDGDIKNFGILGKGEIFGELGFIAHNLRTANVIALEDTRVLMISADKMETIVETHPKESARLFFQMLDVLARRYSNYVETF